MGWSAEYVWIGLPCVLLVSGSVGAEPRSTPTVSAAQQQARDATRLEILRDELLAEEQALARASTRQAERAAAKDGEGIREAEEALDTHTKNIRALRTEIEQAARALTERRRVRDERQGSAAAGRGTPHRWWDAYAQQESARPGQANAVDGATRLQRRAAPAQGRFIQEDQSDE